MLANGRVNLEQLQAEFRAGGIDLPALGLEGRDVFTYDVLGQRADLPIQCRQLLDAHVATWDRDRVRTAVLAAAAGTEGVALVNLTVQQQRALLACLLYQAGALTPQLTVRALNDWLPSWVDKS